MTDQDKDHLVKVMAYGKDQVNWPKKRPEFNDSDYEEPEEIDRFDERNLGSNFFWILNEIHE